MQFILNGIAKHFLCGARHMQKISGISIIKIETWMVAAPHDRNPHHQTANPYTLVFFPPLGAGKFAEQIKYTAMKMELISRIAAIAIIASVFFPGRSIGQSALCSDEYALLQPGKWHQAPDQLSGAIAGFPGKSLEFIFARQDQLLGILKKAYPEPKGLEAFASRIFNTSPGTDYLKEPGEAAFHYSISTYYQHYWCADGKMELATETATRIECYVNAMFQLMEPLSRSKDFVMPNGQQIFYMPYETGTVKGFPLYSTKEKWNGNPRESIIISKDGRLPVLPVSREGFLMALGCYVQDKLKGLEIFHQAAAVTGSGNETLLKKYLNAYKRLEILMADMTEEERSSQAIVSDPSEMLWNRNGEGTFEAQEKIGGRPLVIYDLEYGNNQLPRHSIRFIQLFFNYEDYNATKRDMMRQFRENIDLDLLKALLEDK
jgi:hypothetical protein